MSEPILVGFKPYNETYNLNKITLFSQAFQKMLCDEILLSNAEYNMFCAITKLTNN